MAFPTKSKHQFTISSQKNAAPLATALTQTFPPSGQRALLSRRAAFRPPAHCVYYSLHCNLISQISLNHIRQAGVDLPAVKVLFGEGAGVGGLVD